MTTSPVVTRFAPSPTGHLHVGGARSALFCWAFAKRMGGRFMLRIEDTDAARSSDESARGIMEDLAWLGIEWDDGPALTLADGRVVGANARDVGSYFQARRVAIYNRYIEQLVKVGRAYPAFESNEEVEAQRKAAVAAKQTYRYPRPADVEFGRFTPAMQQRWTRAQAGERHVMRFAAPHAEIVVPDQVLGDVRIAAGELDDFVIRKADGFPTYHFAVVIDDETMGVTHVLRAQEHLANTPRHVAMQQALVNEETGARFRTPVYGHMPLIFNPDGTKMSKRDKAKAARKAAKDAIAKSGKDQAPAATAALAAATGVEPALLADFLAAENDRLDIAEAVAKHYRIALPEIEVYDFRGAGYLPEAMCNFLALLGWNPGQKTADGKDLEKFDNAFLAANFSIERIGRTNAKFDRAKLLSFNADFIAAMTDEEFLRRWLAWVAEYEPAAHAKLTALPREKQLLLAKAVKPRSKTLRDGLKPIEFILAPDEAIVIDPAAKAKAFANGGDGLLREVEAALRALPEERWTPSELHGVLESVAKAHNLVNDKGALNVGPVAAPVRVALSGAGVTPPLGETLAVLGKTATLARLRRVMT